MVVKVWGMDLKILQTCTIARRSAGVLPGVEEDTDGAAGALVHKERNASSSGS